MEIDRKRLQILRKNILQASAHSQEGHIPSAFSILDILYCLYILLPKSSKINFEKDDFFILSKGHASLAMYAILEEAKIIGSEWQTSFGDFTSNFGGHPDMKKIPGIKASTGSLGHGLPIAIGRIMAKRSKNIKARAFCLVGDGELNEGSIWESLMIASHHSLHELTVVIDCNGSGDRALRLGSVQDKFSSFGFNVSTIDGHDHQEIISSLNASTNNQPSAVIAQTIKGYGLSEMENNPAWHHASPTLEQLNKFVSELK